MAFDTVMESQRNGNLVGRAMHRNSFLSVEGVGERVFSFAFRGLATRKTGNTLLWIWPPWRSSPTITLSPSLLAGAMC